MKIEIMDYLSERIKDINLLKKMRYPLVLDEDIQAQRTLTEQLGLLQVLNKTNLTMLFLKLYKTNVYYPLELIKIN